MNKVNYDSEFTKLTSSLNGKPTLLLHSCCAPCSSAVLKRVCQFFCVTVLYYNPNIYPKEEYDKRKAEQIKLCKMLNICFMDCDYSENDFYEQIVGLEQEQEGGKRCNKCFYIRLNKTANLAEQNDFEYFGTTLTVSPHKNADVINQIGQSLEEKYNVKFLLSDFKKKDGYLESINLSKEYNLYRQNYCGCKFSMEN